MTMGILALVVCFVVPILSVWLARLMDNFKAYNAGKFELNYVDAGGEDVAHVMAFAVPAKNDKVHFGDNLYNINAVTHIYNGRDLDPSACVRIEILIGEPL